MDTLLSILLYFLCKFSLDSVNGWIPVYAISCVGRKEDLLMMDTDFFKLLYTHLEEREFNNVCQNLKQDENYLEVSREEAELYNRFESLNLPKEQKETIRNWIEAIHAQNAAYTMVVFRMAMQCCFSLLVQLADLK